MLHTNQNSDAYKLADDFPSSGSFPGERNPFCRKTWSHSG